MDFDAIISVRGATLSLRRAIALAILRPDEIATLERPTELDAARSSGRVATRPKAPKRTKPRAPVCAMCRGDLGAVTYQSPRGLCCRDCHEILSMENGSA